MFTNIAEVFMVFLRLGLVSFGGPIAHLGFFHNEFVAKRKWLDEHTFADLVSLCQFLPGPASSQVGIAIGLKQAGPLGAFAAWLGFTLPSALILVAFGLGINTLQGQIHLSFLHGLKLVAVPVVAQALWGMGTKLCTSKLRATISVAACLLATLLPFGFGQITVLLVAAIVGYLFLKDQSALPHVPINVAISRRVAAIILSTFVALLFLLPKLAQLVNAQSLNLFDSFFRAGALVFGGGHVVLPLLKSEVVTPGWVSADLFMTGYGAAQAIPGPLFSFTAYLGAVATIPPSGIAGAAICLVAAFLPSFFLVFGTLPFWEEIRKSYKMRSAVQGINAAVVGLLLAAFYNPVWTSAVLSPKDFALAAIGFLLLVFWKFPSWAVVLLSAIAAMYF